MPPKVGRRPAAKAKAAVRVLVGARPKVRAARPKIRARPGALRRPAASTLVQSSQIRIGWLVGKRPVLSTWVWKNGREQEDSWLQRGTFGRRRSAL